jgi:hypothetical protein
MKNCNEKTLSSFLLACHHLLVTNIRPYFFHTRFEIIFYNYNQLYNHLGHVTTDFLVAKDIIPSNESCLVVFISYKTNYKNVTYQTPWKFNNLNFF